MIDKTKPKIEWCRDADQAKVLARLFFENLTASYISHSELQSPRATSPHSWAPDIDQLLQKDAVSRIASPLDPLPGTRTLLAAGLTVDGTPLGVFFVTFSREAPVPFCILEDMVVAADARGHGYGDLFMKWLSDECGSRGIDRIFLESGIENHRAHHLFEREGFKTVSIVMMRQLGK